ncbi:MAG TPA: hypothetical protein VKC52_03180 [Acidimicrobiia bacterium]|nr:hypothetical protein [Acidimicrobiia bacterium]
MEKNPTPGEIVVMAGAGLALIFSFLPFYKIEVANFSDNSSAWDSGLFPVATLIPIFAVIAGMLVALVRFGNVQYPPGGFLGFTRNTLLLALTFFAAILAVAYLIADKPAATSLGFGYWFVLIGAVGSLVGAALMMNEAQTRA